MELLLISDEMVYIHKIRKSLNHICTLKQKNRLAHEVKYCDDMVTISTHKIFI